MRRQLATLCAVGAVLGLCGACTDDDPDGDQVDRCAEIIATMAICYPDLAAEATCTEETIRQFEIYGLDAETCDSIDGMGKADVFSFGGCGEGQHECGWIFCCDDYELTWFPQGEEDWNIVSVVTNFQSQVPTDVEAQIVDASYEQLRAGVSASYVQDVVEYEGGPAREMAVHVTRQLMTVPYAEFVQLLPAQDWGIQLDHYLGGEVRVYEEDAQGRATRQLERMVLSPFPCDYESALSNNDMTKVEVIVYEQDWATVYWRVMYSNNNSTETDVGSVDFWGIDDQHTVVTFHSAHRLNAPGGIHIPNVLLAPALEMTFLDFVRHYREIVE